MNRDILDAIPQGEKGYARFSYAWEPPPIKGYRVIHVKGHRKYGVWVQERWYYRKLDPKTGLVIGGVNARDRMAELGITQCNPRPEELAVLPSTIGAIHNNLEQYTKIPRSQWKKRTRYRTHRRPRKESVAVNAERKLIEANTWVPVYFIEGGRISGWFELNAGAFYSLEQIEPGMPGVVRRDMKIIGDPSGNITLTGVPKNKGGRPRKSMLTGSATVNSGVTVPRRARRRRHAENEGLCEAVLVALRMAPADGWTVRQIREQMEKNGYRVKGDQRNAVGMALAGRVGKYGYGIVRLGRGIYTIR